MPSFIYLPDCKIGVHSFQGVTCLSSIVGDYLEGELLNDPSQYRLLDSCWNGIVLRYADPKWAWSFVPCIEYLVFPVFMASPWACSFVPCIEYLVFLVFRASAVRAFSVRLQERSKTGAFAGANTGQYACTYSTYTSRYTWLILLNSYKEA